MVILSSSGDLRPKIDHEETDKCKQNYMEYMIRTLLDDALIQPSHVVLHPSLGSS